MKKLTMLVLLAGVAGLVWLALPAQGDGLAEGAKAQAKLLSYRAARVDGMRKLSERIYGLHITSETTVQDFVAESDSIKTAMKAFLQGAREASKPKYLDDGTCELKMEVTLEEVVTTLKECHHRYYKGNKFKADDFTQMTQTNNIKIITETGTGAQPSGVDEIEPVKQGESIDSSEYFHGKAKDFWAANVTGQGRLMAVRAARVDGMRKLAERLKGVQITSETQVNDFVTDSDQVNALTQAMLKGARENGICYHSDELIVEVEMAVTWRTVTDTVKQWADRNYKGDKAWVKEFEERTQKISDQVITEKGMGVPPAKYVKGDQKGAIEGLESQKWPPLVRETGTAAIDTENENKAQAKLMAFRAAELDARRKIAERIDGLMIDSSTSVKDFVAQNDRVRTAMETFQQGAYVEDGSQKVLKDGTVTVSVAIDPSPLWDVVMKYKKVVAKTTKEPVETE